MKTYTVIKSNFTSIRIFCKTEHVYDNIEGAEAFIKIQSIKNLGQWTAGAPPQYFILVEDK